MYMSRVLEIKKNNGKREQEYIFITKEYTDPSLYKYIQNNIGNYAYKGNNNKKYSLRLWESPISLYLAIMKIILNFDG